jgi:hypothetical protein
MATLRTHGRRLLCSVVPVLMLLTTSQAHASAIYTYTGSAFTVTNVDGPTPPADVYTSTDFVSGTVELSAPLAPNLDVWNSGFLTPLSFSFSDGVNTITNTSATQASFSFGTDALGNIVYWQARLAMFTPHVGGGTSQSIDALHYPAFAIFSGETRDFAADTLCGPASTSGGCAYFGDPYYTQGAQVRVAGTWQLQPSQPVPAPDTATMVLFGTALVGVMARRRATSRHSSGTERY